MLAVYIISQNVSILEIKNNHIIIIIIIIANVLLSCRSSIKHTAFTTLFKTSIF